MPRLIYEGLAHGLYGDDTEAFAMLYGVCLPRSEAMTETWNGHMESS